MHCALQGAFKGLHWGRAMPEAPLIPSLVLLPTVKIITLNGFSDLWQLPLQFKWNTGAYAVRGRGLPVLKVKILKLQPLG